MRSARATDTYTCDGRPEAAVYEPRFTYHGFRYTQVEGWPIGSLGPPPPSAFSKREVHSDVEWASNDPYAAPPPGVTFSSPVLNNVQSMCARVQTSNLHSVPTDCDQRDERQGWAADASVSAEEAISNFDMQAFYRRWLLVMADVQVHSTMRGGRGVSVCGEVVRERALAKVSRRALAQSSASTFDDCSTSNPIWPDCNGTVTDTIPHVPGLFGNRPADPSWGAALPIVYDLSLRYYGAWGAARQLYPVLANYSRFLSRVAAATGGLVTFHYYGDWVRGRPAYRAATLTPLPPPAPVPPLCGSSSRGSSLQPRLPRR